MWRVYKHTGKENDHEDTKRHRAQQQIKLERRSESLIHRLENQIGRIVL